MGAIKKFVGSIFGSSKPKSQPVQRRAEAPANTQVTDPASQETEDEKQKKQRIALNAAGYGGQSGQPLGDTTKATVTKRNLLGL